MESKRLSPMMVGLWILLAIAPLFHVWSTLTTDFLADNPLAYLVWIPVVAFAWAFLRLLSMAPYPDDRELNSILGMTGIILFGLVLALGSYHWPWAFSIDNLGILIWPFWALSLAWFLFGVGTTRRLIHPLAYVLLAWPPLYTRIVAWTMPALNQLDLTGMHWLDRVPWIRPEHGSGVYLVQSVHSWIPIQISQVCSGADSLLAILLFLPVVLAFFRGSGIWKLTLLVSVAVGAVVLNFLRLQIILFLLHATNANLALGIVHPILGFLLLAMLFTAMLGASPLFHLQAQFPKLTAHLRPPRPVPLGIAIVAGFALWQGLTPLGQWGPGTPSHPVAVATTRLSAYLPRIAGFHRTVALHQSEESVMGPGSETLAVDYANGTSVILAEVWRTQDPLVLAGLGGRNCLLFHGDRVLNASPVSLFHHVPGNVFVVAAPTPAITRLGPEYIDVEYTASTELRDGHRWYFRVEVAGWVSSKTVSQQAAIRAGHQVLAHIRDKRTTLPLLAVLEVTAQRLNLTTTSA
ncbi:archaeosortase/exosortase family protein [Sulfobacillus harzensis]|uniref:Exosortase/archaeosortase family protein n=1 Tax=Sulfobacillus harzensis TaxID=2729629 RepID=A0A7Y0L183_9FIRM|nr:archaeosortase/exosortase family protein [Sulfobacillus harzensis]NMP20876.1 exosortase/archaeosortase family protein [Sulfobacillus harzensis]